MEAINRILKDNGVRLYYVRTAEGQSPTVANYLVAAVVVNEPSPEYLKYDIEQCVVFIGRMSLSPMYFKKSETPEDAYRRIEACAFDVYRPVTLYNKEHAIEVLSHLKTVSAVNAKWRSYYDQTETILNVVLGLVAQA